MTYALIGVIAALLLYVLWLNAQIAQERRDWRDERSELLTRIQRPELVPRFHATEGGPAILERKADEWDKVGHVDLSEPDGDG